MKIRKFRSIIWSHYRKNKQKNNFPWRKTRNPYHILVSEIMLQQTQIPRVIPKYKEWFVQFPTLKALSEAPFSKVLTTWHGLGYNRRSRFLKDTATIIQTKHKGVFPHSPDELEKLPGIGSYTSRALRCFAFGACEPFLDTNIRRVFIHFFAPRLPSTMLGARRSGRAKQEKKIDDAWILSLIEKTEPAHNRPEWYGALMDYGRDVLGALKENPNKKSASYKKQSPFLGSKRYIRAKIIHYLISQKSATPAQIKRALAENPRISKQAMQKQFPLLISSLKKERLIAPQKNLFVIQKN